MGRYITNRIVQLILLLLCISFIVFLSIHLVPGDPAQVMAGPQATKSDLAAVRKSLGLNKPLMVQYFDYMRNIFHGNFGISYQTHQPVLQAIMQRLPETIKLATSSMILAVIIGIPLGILSALRQNSWIDFSSTSVSLLGVSIPHFWLGTMLILLFAVNLKWLPIGGLDHPFYTIAGFKELILPSITLGTGSAALIARTTRSTMLEVIQQDYVRTAKAKGVASRDIVMVHELKNAMIPVITIIGINFGSLLGGTIITEQVFAINGVGRLMINAISSRDFPVVQGTVLFIAGIFIFVNLLVDLLYVKIDPRVSYE